ncbi:hypothetical protein TNCV_1257701 [Trichonephila clavipes]|nr:hypothetical protein TNCV_1257701 [Trichonephila clavipes]
MQIIFGLNVYYKVRERYSLLRFDVVILVQNASKKTKKSTMFVGGREWCRGKVNFVFTIFHIDLTGMYPLYIIVNNSGQRKILLEDHVQSGYFACLRGRTIVFGASYCVCSRNSIGSWQQNDTKNSYKLMTSKSTPSQTPSSVHSTDTKPMRYAMPTVSSKGSWKCRVEIYLGAKDCRTLATKRPVKRLQPVCTLNIRLTPAVMVWVVVSYDRRSTSRGCFAANL